MCVRVYVCAFEIVCVCGVCSHGTQALTFDSATLPPSKPHARAAFLFACAQWLRGRPCVLLYRGSTHGLTPLTFHSRCDNQGPTLTLVQASDGCVFGGYAGAGWQSGRDRFVRCEDAFVFSVVGPQGVRVPVVRYPLAPGKEDRALRCSACRGPTFGGAWGVCNVPFTPTDVFGPASFCSMEGTYVDVSGLGNKAITGTWHFNPVEVEVYAVGMGHHE